MDVQNCAADSVSNGKRHCLGELVCPTDRIMLETAFAVTLQAAELSFSTYMWGLLFAFTHASEQLIVKFEIVALSYAP
jgi:hypothetical protein